LELTAKNRRGSNGPTAPRGERRRMVDTSAATGEQRVRVPQRVSYHAPAASYFRPVDGRVVSRLAGDTRTFTGYRVAMLESRGFTFPESEFRATYETNPDGRTLQVERHSATDRRAADREELHRHSRSGFGAFRVSAERRRLSEARRISAPK